MATCLMPSARTSGSSSISLGGLALQRHARCPGLAWCPVIAGGAVVEDDHEDVGLVVGDVDERRQPGVEERRVADDRDHALLEARLRRAVRDCDRRAHAAAEVQRRERRQEGERVAADVAGDGDLLLGEELEDAAVRAAGAEHRRARGQLGLRDATRRPARRSIGKAGRGGRGAAPRSGRARR